MPTLRLVASLGLLVFGLAACDDKQAQNNAPTKPDTEKLEPQTDQTAPGNQKPLQVDWPAWRLAWHRSARR